MESAEFTENSFNMLGILFLNAVCEQLLIVDINRPAAPGRPVGPGGPIGPIVPAPPRRPVNPVAPGCPC